MKSISIVFLSIATIPAASAQGPNVSQIQNNYSFILPGMPNYGIAPGSLFIVQGTGLNSQPLSSLQSSAPPGLPTLLNGTSIAVTVGAITTHPGLYYTSPGLLGAVLPSDTPVGTGTLVVTTDDVPSPAVPINVVASALGFDTLSGLGAGFAVAQDANYNLLGLANPAQPGQTISLWGSGVGADPANDDRTFPQQQDNLTAISFQVFIGGIQAKVAYRGRSQYPGVDQIVVTVPTSVTSGCYVSVIAVSGAITSNTVTLPVSSTMGACSDPTYPEPISQLLHLGQEAVIHSATLGIEVDNSISGAEASTGASFQAVPGSSIGGYSGIGLASVGSCTIIPPQIGINAVQPTALDLGTLSLSSGHSTVSIPPIPAIPGVWGTDLPQNFVVPGASFQFMGSGGMDVGRFTEAGVLPPAFTWNELLTTALVNRANGITVSWSGGEPGTFVTIQGNSVEILGKKVLGALFLCTAPVEDQQFTVPPSVLLQLPPGSHGSLVVRDSTLPQVFTASGLDIGVFSATIGNTISVPYQ